ncbi:MAG: hypothetical protein ABFD89_09635 [Bryobacteraceae bacterium]
MATEINDEVREWARHDLDRKKIAELEHYCWVLVAVSLAEGIAIAFLMVR